MSDFTLIDALITLLAFNLGILVGAWWASRPISDLEKRVEFDTRDEHEELMK